MEARKKAEEISRYGGKIVRELDSQSLDLIHNSLKRACSLKLKE
jgi:hypothetical protein